MILYTYFSLFLKGAAISIASWAFAGGLSLVIGTLLGILSCKKLSSKPLFIAIKLYTFVAKGIPAYVQILIAYYVLPSLLHITIPGFLAANLALAFCSSGYVTEIVRSGINTIPAGQWDACFVLGYSHFTALVSIIMPQVTRITLSALFGEFEQLLKSTSLLATIGITELTRVGMNIFSRELNPLPVYATIAGVYLLFSAVLNIVNFYMEKRMHRDCC